MNPPTVTPEWKPSVFGGDHAYLDLSPFLPAGTRTIIVAENRYGLRPKRLSLPHQIYRDQLNDYEGRIAILPVDPDAWFYIDPSVLS
jgi:hypothetical protein